MRLTPLVAVALFASPALAETNNELWIGPTKRALRTTSANALTKDSLTGGELGYARVLGLELPYSLQLAADATFDWGGADGTMFKDSIQTEIGVVSFMASGRLRYPVHNRVTATARLGVGMSRATLDMYIGTPHIASDHGWGATSEASLAVDLDAIASPELRLGVRFELGYVGAAPIALSHKVPTSSDTLQLMTQSASLGSLNLSGPVFAMSAVSEF